MLPTRDADLARTETLQPLTGRPSGEDVKIDKGVLGELYDRLADAIGAVERGNNRIVGNNRLWACTDAVWRTGKPGGECGAAK